MKIIVTTSWDTNHFVQATNLYVWCDRQHILMHSDQFSKQFSKLLTYIKSVHYTVTQKVAFGFLVGKLSFLQKVKLLVFTH